VTAALAEPDLDAAVRQLVGLLLEHAGGRLADDVLLVLGEPGVTQGVRGYSRGTKGVALTGGHESSQ
jgi:hypothetical protein